MYLFFCVNLSLLRLAFSSPLLSLLCLSLRLSLSVSHSVSRFGSLSLSLAPVERGGAAAGGGGGRGTKERLCKGGPSERPRAPDLHRRPRVSDPAAIGECGVDACKVGWSRVSGHAVRRSAPLSTPRQPPRPRTANPGIATNPRRPPLVLSLWPEPPPRG